MDHGRDLALCTHESLETLKAVLLLTRNEGQGRLGTGPFRRYGILLKGLLNAIRSGQRECKEASVAPERGRGLRKMFYPGARKILNKLAVLKIATSN